MFKNELFILGLIVLVGAFLRFYHLDSLPPSLEWDEVATGYDAYSILKTGRDQYGHFLPLTFRSLDDYKPPLYTYLTSISIVVWGWNDFAVRSPAAFLGILAIITTYGMTHELFNNKKLALLSALFLSISPWHVNFSRLALETNSTIFFTTAGVWAFLAGLRKGPYLILSAILLGLNLYLYHNARVFIPLLGLVLLVLNWKDLLSQKKYLVIAGIIIVVFIIRLVPIALSIEGQMRLAGTSIFTPAVPLEITEQKELYAAWKQVDQTLDLGFLGRLFHSDKVLFGIKIAKNYVSHFDPTFLFFTNDSPRHHAEQVGLLYLIELPLLYVGFYYLLKNELKKSVIIMIVWLLFTPIPASVTRDAPHALRTAIFMPTFQILVALALIGMQKTFSKKVYTAILAVVLIGYLVNSAFFFHQYFVHFATDTSESWQYGRKEAAEYVEAVKSQYERIIVSTKLEQPQAFFLYYTRYDPVAYLQAGGTISGGWAEDRNHFDKYYFKPINYEKMRDGHTLFVGLPEEFPSEAIVIKQVNYLDGKTALRIVKG